MAYLKNYWAFIITNQRLSPGLIYSLYLKQEGEGPSRIALQNVLSQIDDSHIEKILLKETFFNY